MNLQRMKFAWARGARIQGDERREVIEVWDTHNAPSFGSRYVWRIHPDDEHLQYGLFSTALREKVFGRSNGFSAEAVWIASTLFNDATLPHFHGVIDDYGTVDFFHLFLAEMLADEGL